MEAEFAQSYRDLYLRHWWFQARRRLLLATLDEHLPSTGCGKILDVGCGDGLFFEDLRRWGEPSGVETDPSIVTAEGRRGGTIHVTRFDGDFQPGERYGLILMLDVLEHLDDDRAAVARAAELLVPGGRFVATVPAARWLWTHHDEINHHRRRYRRRELAQAIESGGLRLRRPPRYFFHWLVAVKLLVRARERLLGPATGGPEVPPAALNRFFYALSRAEERTLGGARVPFGSSILAVAERPR